MLYWLLDRLIVSWVRVCVCVCVFCEYSHSQLTILFIVAIAWVLFVVQVYLRAVAGNGYWAHHTAIAIAALEVPVIPSSASPSISLSPREQVYNQYLSHYPYLHPSPPLASTPSPPSPRLPSPSPPSSSDVSLTYEQRKPRRKFEARENKRLLYALGLRGMLLEFLQEGTDL